MYEFDLGGQMTEAGTADSLRTYDYDERAPGARGSEIRCPWAAGGPLPLCVGDLTWVNSRGIDGQSSTYDEAGDLHELTLSCYRRMPLLSINSWRQMLSEVVQPGSPEL